MNTFAQHAEIVPAVPLGEQLADADQRTRQPHLAGIAALTPAVHPANTDAPREHPGQTETVARSEPANLVLPGGWKITAEVFDAFSDPNRPPVVSVWSDTGDDPEPELDAAGVDALLSQLPVFEARLRELRAVLVSAGREFTGHEARA